ncbi:uncharacterized protein [Branchiostoma lanceolatum]|uniref:uncharacterized protein n=1 Tax=Branchiostoma lanceolatum TaxID=7740 RepID=UPI0034525360
MVDLDYIASFSRCCISAVGMLANLLILFIVARYPAMRTACNVYVANLAATDFAFCLLVLIQSIQSNVANTVGKTMNFRLLEDFCNNIWNELNSTNTNITNHTSPSMAVDNCTGHYAERERMFESYCMEFEEDLNSIATIRKITTYVDKYMMAENCTWPYLSAAMFPSLQQAELNYKMPGWTFLRSCDVSRVIAIFLVSASILLLTVIAVERHKAITNPLSSRQHGTVKHAGKTCALVWMASALAAAIDTITRNIVTNDWTFTGTSLHTTSSCVLLKIESSDASHPFFVMVLLTFLFLYIFPICIIIPLYVRILVKVRQSRRLAVRATRLDDQAFLMVFVVTVFFLVTWLPFHIVSFLIHRFVLSETEAPIDWVIAIAMFNSVANPFLYALVGKNFRDQLKKMICCKQWWNCRLWRRKSEASPDTTITIQVIGTTGRVQAKGGTGEVQVTGGAGQGQATGRTGQAQAITQAQAKGGAGQTQTTGTTGQAQGTGGTDQGQAKGGTEQAQAIEEKDTSQTMQGRQTQAMIENVANDR